MERATRIELAFSAWEADVLPLNYARGVSNPNAGRAQLLNDAYGGGSDENVFSDTLAFL